MKYQFQFAGANTGRRSSSHRKWVRVVLLGLAFVLAVLAYWQYLRHLTSGERRLAPRHPVVAASAATATVATAAKASTGTATTAKTAEAAKADLAQTAARKVVAADHPATAAATATTTASVTAKATASVKKAADATVTAVGDYVSHVFHHAPAVPMHPAESAKAPTISSVATASDARPQPVEVATPTMRISYQQPPTAPKPRDYTPEQRLMRAGMTAFNNVLDQASKYPDAYGFRAQDAFADATLGKPMPVYTISQADRAKYESGQPIKPLLKPSGEWVFPVKVGDYVCCMARVKYDDHKYVPENGSKMLGQAWDKILERWPVSKGYHPCFVKYSGIPGYYFTIPQLPTPNMTDIIHLSDYDPSLSPAGVILASWR